MDWTAFQFAVGEFAHGQRPPPPQTGRMTRKKLTALIQAGYGQGHFQRYKPWLRVTKRDYSPHSHVGHLPARSLGRIHHFRSIAERSSILVTKWLGASDVREAYPVWPWPHAHPGCGLPGFDEPARLPGLEEIAEAAGITHGTFPGTNISYVATLDLLTTWRRHGGGYRLVALENKPWQITYAPDPLSRPKERLELTRRYCRLANIPHRIIHAEKLPQELVVNLEILEPRTTLERQDQLASLNEYRDIVDVFKARAYSTPPNNLLADIQRRRHCSGAVLTAAFHLALWRQDVDHDLSQPFRPWQPLCHGGLALKTALFDAWIGDEA